jgi:hypothetical protein
METKCNQAVNVMNFQITFLEFTNSAVRERETRNGTVRGSGSYQSTESQPPW